MLKPPNAKLTGRKPSTNYNEEKDHDQNGHEACAPVERDVMRDIKSAMTEVTKLMPVNNAGSFPLTLLWQIFEAADESFERSDDIKCLTDNQIEEAFKVMFPVFLSEYPKTLELDV